MGESRPEGSCCQGNGQALCSLGRRARTHPVQISLQQTMGLLPTSSRHPNGNTCLHPTQHSFPAGSLQISPLLKDTYTHAHTHTHTLIHTHTDKYITHILTHNTNHTHSLIISHTHALKHTCTHTLSHTHISEAGAPLSEPAGDRGKNLHRKRRMAAVTAVCHPQREFFVPAPSPSSSLPSLSSPS